MVERPVALGSFEVRVPRHRVAIARQAVHVLRQLLADEHLCLDAEQRARRQATAHPGDVVTGAQMVEPAVVRVLDEQPERQGLMVDPGRGGERRARIELVRQPQPRRPHALPVEREVIEAAADRRDQTRAEGLIHRNEGTRLVRSQRLVQVESFVDGVDAGQLRSVEDAGAAERTSGRRAPREGGPGTQAPRPCASGPSSRTPAPAMLAEISPSNSERFPSR